MCHIESIFNYQLNIKIINRILLVIQIIISLKFQPLKYGIWTKTTYSCLNIKFGDKNI